MHGKGFFRYVLGFLLLCPACIGTLSADGFITREEALTAAFPGAQIRSETLFLTPDHQKEAAVLSGVEIPTRMIARYIASKDGAILGRGYIDTHVVHSRKESLLILLDADGILFRIETTASEEGPEHLAPESWYQQYKGKPLSDDLYIHRAIHPIAGATLTALATNRAVRRILAIDIIMNRERKNGQ